MRITNYNAATKAIAANSTTVFTLADVPGNKVVAYHLSMSGTGGVFGGTGLNRIRVKNNGQALWDILPAHLNAFYQRMSKSNLALTLGTTVRFTLPFYRLDLPDGAERMADKWQFPKNGNPTIELVYGAAGTGAVEIGYTQTDVEGEEVPLFYGSQMNIADGASQGYFPFGKPNEVIQGFSIDTTGLGRVQFTANGKDLIKCDADSTNGSLYLELQQLQNMNTVTSPLFYKFADPVLALPGDSYLYLDTNGAGTWAGVTNELSLYSTKPMSSFQQG